VPFPAAAVPDGFTSVSRARGRCSGITAPPRAARSSAEAVAPSTKLATAASFCLSPVAPIQLACGTGLRHVGEVAGCVAPLAVAAAPCFTLPAFNVPAADSGTSCVVSTPYCPRIELPSGLTTPLVEVVPASRSSRLAQTKSLTPLANNATLYPPANSEAATKSLRDRDTVNLKFAVAWPPAWQHRDVAETTGSSVNCP
jgi:hypothetical protein